MVHFEIDKLFDGVRVAAAVSFTNLRQVSFFLVLLEDALPQGHILSELSAPPLLIKLEVLFASVKNLLQSIDYLEIG